MGNNSDTCQNLDQVRFNFLSYNLNMHEKIVLIKGLGFANPPNTIEYSEFLIPFEILSRYITSLEVNNFNKECVKCVVAHIHHLNRFMRFSEYSFHRGR